MKGFALDMAIIFTVVFAILIASTFKGGNNE